MFKDSYGTLERKRQALLKRIANAGPFIMATASWQNLKCGNPKCKCNKDKEARHRKLHLTWSRKNSHSSQYVPVALHKEVLQWVENYWTIKEYMQELSSLSHKMIKIYSQSKGRSGPQKISKPRSALTAIGKKKK